MTPTLTARLDAAWSGAGDPPLCVAFSGGPDSTALLHALAGLQRDGRRLRALHVDHGLHPDSQDWAASCAALCGELGVPLHTLRVSVDANGQGPEAAAREARYAAFAEILGAGEWLVTAHHREDQAETVLLKLLRGAGPHGLGGMRERRALGRGQLWRPLLDTPRGELEEYAQAAGLQVVEDPANRDSRMARSYLRHEILPRLERHWPHAVSSLVHAARLQRDQADFLDQHARAALEALAGGDGGLAAAGWVASHPALRARILECWLHDRGLPAPTAVQRAELERQVREAAADRVPCVAWPDAEVRLWRGRLHAMAPLPAPPEAWSALWKGHALDLPAGALRWSEPAQDGEAPTIRVRIDVPGLRLQPHGDRHHRALGDLFQQAGVPPWRRRFCPILYAADDTLLGVADLWTTAAGEELFRSFRMRPCWQPPG